MSRGESASCSANRINAERSQLPIEATRIYRRRISCAAAQTPSAALVPCRRTITVEDKLLMSRKGSRRRRHRSPNQAASRLRAPIPRRKPFYRRGSFWAWTLSLALSGLALGAAYSATIRPRFAVDISSPSLEISSPVPLTFTATKSGLLAAYKIDYLCYAFEIHALGPAGPIFNVTDSWMGPYHLTAKMEGAGTSDFTCFSIKGAASYSSKGDIEAVVKYEYRSTLWPAYDCARFAIEPNATGTTQWSHKQPLNCRNLWKCVERNDNAWRAYKVAVKKAQKKGKWPQSPKNTDCGQTLKE
jgi:hypothetical protein